MGVRVISQAQSLLNISIAALIGTAMIGIGLYGNRRDPANPTNPRRKRPLWLVAGTGGAVFALFVANAELRFVYGGAQLFAAAVASVMGLILSLFLIRRGVKGRYVGDHPHCRKCGFDLFGRPDGVNRCSECGSDLDASRAIVTGIHRRRPVALLSGVFLIIVSLAVGVGVARSNTLSRTGQFDINKHLPTWVLLRRVDKKSPNTMNALTPVDEELIRRGSRGELSRAAIDDLLGKLGNPQLYTTQYYSQSLLLPAWEKGLYTDAELIAELSKSLAFFTNAPKTSAPNVLRYQFWNSAGLWRVQSTGVSASPVLQNVSVDGVTVQASLAIGTVDDTFSGGPHVHKIRLPQPLSPGIHSVEVNYQMTISVAAVGKSTVTFVVPANAKFITEVVPAEELAATRVAWNNLAVPTPLPSVELHTDRDGIRTLWLSSPLELAFLGELYLIPADGSSRQQLGKIYLPHYGGGPQITLPQPSPTSFDLELIPRPELAIELMDTPETYQETVRVPFHTIVQRGYGKRSDIP